MMRIYFLLLVISVFFSVPVVAFSNTNQAKAPDYISNLSGQKGVVLCFHGHGGNAAYWGMNERKAYLDVMVANAYSYVCPSSVNRDDAMWSNVNNSSNPDVKNVDSILKNLNVGSDVPIFLVGHSNGGGFIGRYAMFSSRAGQIKALQYQNASGLPPVLSHESYQIPSLFVGAKCDRVVDFSKISKSMSILDRKNPSVKHELLLLDEYYPSGSNCHPFLSESAEKAAKFFTESIYPVKGSGTLSNNGQKGIRGRLRGYLERRYGD